MECLTSQSFNQMNCFPSSVKAGQYVLTKRALKGVRRRRGAFKVQQDFIERDATPVAKQRSENHLNDAEANTSPHNVRSSEAVTCDIPVSMSIGLASLRRQILSQDALIKLSLHAANVRLTYLESIWTDFGKSWNLLILESTTECHPAVATACYVDAESIYLESKTQLLEQIDTFHSSPVPTASKNMQQFVQMAEPIEVPKFSGKEEDWGIYRQAFQAAVHTNPRLNNAQKLLKLLNSLEGRAKQAVGSHWSTSDDQNFELAWNALCRQYDNEYGTIRAHLRKINELKPLQEASCDGLRNVLDTVRGAHRQLQLLLPTDKVSDYLLLYQIESMLDPCSQLDWALKRKNNELPTLQEMYEYLEVKSATLAGMPKILLPYKQPEEHRRQSAAKMSVPTPIINRGRISEDRPKCDLCPNQFHWPFKCEKFRSLQLEDRKAYVMRHEMCFNCFSRKHEAGKCPDRVCPRCNKHHNSLLCTANKQPIKKATSKLEQGRDTASSSSSTQ